jgi:hypothetical protein
MRKIRRRTLAVRAFPDGSLLLLVEAFRLRHVAWTRQWYASEERTFFAAEYL